MGGGQDERAHAVSVCKHLCVYVCVYCMYVCVCIFAWEQLKKKKKKRQGSKVDLRAAGLLL